MIYVKINNIEYPATIYGMMQDSSWDNRESKEINVNMDFEFAKATFVDGVHWSIITEDIETEYDYDPVTGAPIEGSEHEVVKREEFDNSDFNLAGSITDHRDGSLSIKMGKATDLELAYELLYGGM